MIMLSRAISILKTAPSARPIDDPAVVDEQYRHWRLRVLYSSLVGYALFYFVRKNLSLAMPAMEHDLGIGKQDLGAFLTLHGVFYGVSKFANGFVGDRTNPRYFMALGLVCSAIVNVCFGLSSAVKTFGIFWLLNGWFQGMGFPPCARTLTQWFSPRERGTKFGIWNTSHSVGAAAAFLVCSHLVGIDWRLCFFVPALIAVIGAMFLIERLRDSPQSLGLPSIDAYAAGAQTEGTVEPELDSAAFRRFVIDQVLLNPMIWVVSIANFFVYTVRGSIIDWGPTILTEVKHVQLKHAGWIVAGYEITGMLGMLAGGWMTDRIFRGRAGRACLVYMLVCALCVLLFWKAPAEATFTNVALLCAVGFFIYGPQCLVGVMAANLATRRAAATAIGMTGFFGYLSGVVSGWGLGWIVEHHGWNPAFQLIVAASVVATVLFAVSWNAGQRVVTTRAAKPVVLEVETTA